MDVILADYKNPQHADDIVDLLDCYAKDPMGGGKPLPDTTKDALVEELAKRPYAFAVLVYIEGKAVGLANCFEGFSTFKAKPLVNIHDIIVHPGARGKGVSQALLNKVEEIAREREACKITLEVLSGNKVAQNAYVKFGFKNYELDPEKGHALFWEKPLR